MKKRALIKDLADDSRVHQLNRVGCLVFYIVVAITVSTKQYVGNPIQCWCPAMFTKEQIPYVNSYCWVRNTYIVDFNSSIPSDKYFRMEQEIPYYQWTPIILVLQACMFYVPRMFWKATSGFSSLNIKKFLKMANEATYETGDKRNEKVKNVANYFERYIKIRNIEYTQYRRMQHTNEMLSSAGAHKGNFLVTMFLITSLLYFITSISQIFIVDVLLGVEFKTLGPDIFQRVSKGLSLLDSNRFPVVTFCDFEVRQMVNIQTWTVQCSLPINLYNEKVFILNWFLLVVMSAVNAVYFLYNAVSTCLPYRAEKYVEKFIFLENDILTGKNQKITEHFADSEKYFVHDYLRRDGVFLLWLLSNKTNQVVAGEIIEVVWKNYKKTLSKDI